MKGQPVKKGPGGRPTKYKPEFCDQARKLCALSATDAQIADFFGVSEVTINSWKGKNPEFLKSLKESKEQQDTKVERSLFERAMGYSHPETKVFCQNGEVTEVDTRKHYPPDTTAMIFWLKNRQPAKWRERQEVKMELAGIDELFTKIDSDAGVHNETA